MLQSYNKKCTYASKTSFFSKMIDNYLSHSTLLLTESSLASRQQSGMTGANGFLKKNDCTVVWAAFRDRNFEVGLPKAMSVPSKYNKKCTCASKRTLFYKETID